jgi:toxin ParE1/3/4
MAKIVWTEPALGQLDEIADYIFIDNPQAAKMLVKKIFDTVGKLSKFPEMGSVAREISGRRYRQLTVKPCKIYYKIEGATVFILYIRRFERLSNFP